MTLDPPSNNGILLLMIFELISRGSMLIYLFPENFARAAAVERRSV